MANYKDDFHPGRGDVTYGISPACSAYLGEWKEANDQRMQSTVKAIKDQAADDWAAAFSAAKTNRMDCYNNYYGVPSIGGGSAKKTVQHIDELHDTAPNQRMKAYGEKIVQSRFSPTSVFKEQKGKLVDEGYVESQYTSDKTFDFRKKAHREDQAMAQNRNYLAIRRACKFGIGLVATDSHFAGAKVHFILDGLDMQEVATKGKRSSDVPNAPHGAPQKSAVSITVSELRYVYRNWGLLSGSVILYVNLIPVAAPWLNNWGPLDAIGAFPKISARKDLWDAYGEQRKGKYGVNDVSEIVKSLI